jgi:2-alkyl-3-oxoalkanoate reductase
VKVLVTGASSLLLGGVARTLLERGDEVVCLQRRAVDLDAEQVLADVRDAASVARAASGCDAIVHGAAKVGVIGTWGEYRSINVDGTANALAAARAAGVERFVQVSSPSVAHGGSAIVGARAEPAVTGRKRAWYAESKALAERLALDAVDDDRLGLVVVRPHLVWGPGDTQLVGRIVERAAAGRLALVGGGTALVDTTYVDNAVSAHVAALDAVAPGAACSGRAYVIANGEPRPIRDLVAGICRAAGVPFAPRDVPGPAARTAGSLVERVWPLVRTGEPPLTRFVAEQLGTAHWFDPRPARDDLGWQPSVSLDEGLTRLAESYAVREPT